jgi:CBS domain-containing protein
MKPIFETVGQIKKGNTLLTYEGTPAVKIANDLVYSRWTGMPVVDRDKRVIGMVSEQDLLRALRGKHSLDGVKVEEIMTRLPIVIKEEITLEEASKMMEDNHIHRLPVVRDGILLGTVTRHDLVRAWLGMGMEEA